MDFKWRNWQNSHINILNVSNSWLDPSSRPKDDWWSLSSRGGEEWEQMDHIK